MFLEGTVALQRAGADIRNHLSVFCVLNVWPQRVAIVEISFIHAQASIVQVLEFEYLAASLRVDGFSSGAELESGQFAI